MVHKGSNRRKKSRSRSPPKGSLSSRQTNQSSTAPSSGFQVPQAKEFGGQIKSSGSTSFQVPTAQEFGGEIQTQNTVQSTGFQVPQAQEFGGNIQTQGDALQNIPGLQDFTGDFDRPSLQNLREGLERDFGAEARAQNPIQQFRQLDTGRQAAIGFLSLGINQISLVSGTLKTTQVAQVGTPGLYTGVAGTAGKIATNGATLKITQSWISKMASLTGRIPNPAIVASAVITAIGSYPFAGFIKEEALQTVGFATTSAFKNDDLEAMRAAIELEEQILDPGMWRQIAGGVPIVNIVASLNDFFKAAKLQTSVHKQMFADAQIQQQTGETEQQKWDRISQQQNDQRRDLINFFNEQRIITETQIAQLKSDKAATRNINERKQAEDLAAFWLAYKNQIIQLEREEREAIGKFWLEYRKKLLKLQDENRPSKLVFGLL